MALGFFRGRDFETCLSALKSREIKERRGQSRASTFGWGKTTWKYSGGAAVAEEMGRARRCTEYTKEEMDRQGRRGVSLAKSSSTFVHALAFVPSSSRSSYSSSTSSHSIRSLSSFTAILRLPPSTFLRERNVPYSITLRELRNYIRLGYIVYILYILYIYTYMSSSLDHDRFGCFFDRES